MCIVKIFISCLRNREPGINALRWYVCVFIVLFVNTFCDFIKNTYQYTQRYLSCIWFNICGEIWKVNEIHSKIVLTLRHFIDVLLWGHTLYRRWKPSHVFYWMCLNPLQSVIVVIVPRINMFISYKNISVFLRQAILSQCNANNNAARADVGCFLNIF